MCPRKFEFNVAKNLVIYGPNASGKSTLIDVLDILLSKDGKPTSLALPRGLQESENHPNPFVNSQADRLKGQPYVKLNFTNVTIE